MVVLSGRQNCLCCLVHRVFWKFRLWSHVFSFGFFFWHRFDLVCFGSQHGNQLVRRQFRENKGLCKIPGRLSCKSVAMHSISMLYVCPWYCCVLSMQFEIHFAGMNLMSCIFRFQHKHCHALLYVPLTWKSSALRNWTLHKTQRIMQTSEGKINRDAERKSKPKESSDT